MRRARIAAVVGLLLLTQAGSAHAWFGPPQRFAEEAWTVIVDAAPSGDAIAGWLRPDGPVVAVRAPGGEFGPSQKLGDAATRVSDVSIADDGTAAVVVGTHSPAVFVRDGRGGFARVALPHEDAAGVDVLARAGGAMTVAYSAGETTYVADRERGGDYVVVLEQPSDRSWSGADGPRVARDARGATFAVWTVRHDDETGTEQRVMGAVRPAGGTFAPPARLNPGSAATQLFGVSLAAAGAGSAVAQWAAFDGDEPNPRDTTHLVGAAVARGGVWQTGSNERRGPAEVAAHFPSIAPDGTAAAVARDWPASTVALAPAAGPLGAFADLPVPVEAKVVDETHQGSRVQSRSPTLFASALDARAQLVDVWFETFTPGSGTTGRLLGHLRRADGSWCSASEIAPWDVRHAHEVDLALDGAGGGVLAWANRGGVSLATYTAEDACPPPLRETSPPPVQPPVVALPLPKLVLPAEAPADRARRTARLRLRCAGARACKGWLAASRRAPAARRTRFRIRPGRAATARVLLGAPARRALLRRGRARLRVAGRLKGRGAVGRAVTVVAPG